jgi:hypothetical protein
MRTLTLFLTLLAVLDAATSTPILHGAHVRLVTDAGEPAPGAAPPTATILFDIDGNEARANFKVLIPGKKLANQRLLALSVQAVNGLALGQDAKGVVCQAFDSAGEPLGTPFDAFTRVVLSGSEKQQVVVGLIECRWK